MARQRKAKQSDKDIDEPHLETAVIPEQEQWRLINESGVLNKIKTRAEEDESDAPLAEEIFDAIVIIIPISFLLLLMEILIHFQFGKHPTLKTMVDRMVSGVPSK
ncbi:hypothetical protein C0991_006043 [Blastosporella zonata]|nr:hypothetical protein C0991_006043 [Blastosporella zonata]